MRPASRGGRCRRAGTAPVEVEAAVEVLVEMPLEVLHDRVGCLPPGVVGRLGGATSARRPRGAGRDTAGGAPRCVEGLSPGAVGRPGGATSARRPRGAGRDTAGGAPRCVEGLSPGAVGRPGGATSARRPRGAAAAARPAPPNILPCCRPDVCGDFLAGCLENCTHFPAVCQISNLNHHVFIMQISFTKSLHLRLMHSARLGCRKRTLSVVRAAARP